MTVPSRESSGSPKKYTPAILGGLLGVLVLVAYPWLPERVPSSDLPPADSTVEPVPSRWTVTEEGLEVTPLVLQPIRLRIRDALGSPLVDSPYVLLSADPEIPGVLRQGFTDASGECELGLAPRSRLTVGLASGGAHGFDLDEGELRTVAPDVPASLTVPDWRLVRFILYRPGPGDASLAFPHLTVFAFDELSGRVYDGQTTDLQGAVTLRYPADRMVGFAATSFPGLLAATKLGSEIALRGAIRSYAFEESENARVRLPVAPGRFDRALTAVEPAPEDFDRLARSRIRSMLTLSSHAVLLSGLAGIDTPARAELGELALRLLGRCEDEVSELGEQELDEALVELLDDPTVPSVLDSPMATSAAYVPTDIVLLTPDHPALARAHRMVAAAPAAAFASELLVDPLCSLLEAAATVLSRSTSVHPVARGEDQELGAWYLGLALQLVSEGAGAGDSGAFPWIVQAPRRDEILDSLREALTAFQG